MKARTDTFGRCHGCGRRLKRKATTCSSRCTLIVSEITHPRKPRNTRNATLNRQLENFP
jgi:predicted nucleic acid-binding Zn ribbon protein